MVGPATFLAFFVAGPARPPQTCHASRDTSRTAPKEPMPCPYATGLTTVSRSRHRRKQGTFSRHRREAALWRRSPQRLAQVPGHPGAGPINWWGPAPRNCFQCFPMAQVSKRKTDLLRLAGGPAPPGERTCATSRGRRRPATPAETLAGPRRRSPCPAPSQQRH